MANVTEPTGGVSHDGMPLRPDTKIDTGLADETWDAMLGQRWQNPNGGFFELVKATATVATAGNKCFKWVDSAAHTVTVTASTGDATCGITVAGLPDLVSGDYFVIQRGAGALVNVIDDGSAASVNDYVQATTAGEVVVDAAYEYGITLGQAREAIAADATGTIRVVAGGTDGTELDP